jgi:hypothetical protein
MVTTLIGAAGPVVQFARSAAPSFRAKLPTPHALALRVPSAAPASSGARAGADPDSDRDIGRLYIGCDGGVHAFDLSAGERQLLFPLPTLPGGMSSSEHTVTGLAVSHDGARLFVVATTIVFMVDLRTGSATPLVGVPSDSMSMGMGGGSVAGLDGSGPQAGYELRYAEGCVIDELTRSLVMSESDAARIVRLRGVDV